MASETSAAPYTVPLLINGIEETTSATFDVISPYTSTTCWTASSATPADSIRAVEAAEAAFPSWSSTKPTTRRDILLRAADLLEERLVENSSFMRTEMGADVGASQFFVVPLSIRMLRDLAGRITGICGSVPVVEEEGQSAIVFKEAIGVTLGVVPWNAPYVFGIRAAACALAAGCTAILKSSELSPRCYVALARAFTDAGLPAGCFNVISCPASDAAEVVNTMIAHPAVRKINFTGSTAVGRKIAKVCGENLKPCLMELGGKNSAIVCEDADLNLAVPQVIASCFLNSGQICMAADRILVHASISAAFTAAIQAALAQSASSSPEAPTLVTAGSKARAEALVSTALSSGAQIIHGPAPAAAPPSTTTAGVRFAPTILGSVAESSPVWQDEVFASLACLKVVSSDDEAIAVANSGGYGLSASIFTADLRKGLKMARKIESGAVHINSMTIHDEAVLPHGGVRNSGWGRFNGDMGLNEFLVTKTVTWMD